MPVSWAPGTPTRTAIQTAGWGARRARACRTSRSYWRMIRREPPRKMPTRLTTTWERMPRSPSSQRLVTSNTTQRIPNHRSTRRWKSGSPPVRSARSRSPGVMSRSLERNPAVTRVAHVAAPAVEANARLKKAQSYSPDRTSLAATLIPASGTTATTERRSTPGRAPARAGTRKTKVRGMA